jgi:hypothetical protein
MEFRLIYKGELPSQDSAGAKTIKHEIRKKLHPQLKELWKLFPFLSKNIDMDFFQRNFDRHGFRFRPLVIRQHEIVNRTVQERGIHWAHRCALDILFLRQGASGKLISNGDIDNRIKVLFDGLRLVKDLHELDDDASPEMPNEDPFYVLLEDDELITEFKVTTDRLLAPLENPRDVMLIIHVTTPTIDPTEDI